MRKEQAYNGLYFWSAKLHSREMMAETNKWIGTFNSYLSNLTMKWGKYGDF